MGFNEFLIDLKNKTDAFFNAEALCYDSGENSLLLLYNNVEKTNFYELINK